MTLKKHLKFSPLNCGPHEPSLAPCQSQILLCFQKVTLAVRNASCSSDGQDVGCWSVGSSCDSRGAWRVLSWATWMNSGMMRRLSCWLYVSRSSSWVSDWTTGSPTCCPSTRRSLARAVRMQRRPPRALRRHYCPQVTWSTLSASHAFWNRIIQGNLKEFMGNGRKDDFVARTLRSTHRFYLGRVCHELFEDCSCCRQLS